MRPTFKRDLSRRLIDALSAAGIRRGAGPSQRFMLTVTGRKSGIPRSTPVSVVVDGPTRYLVGPYGEVAWVRNARVAGVVTLARGRNSERFSLAPVEGTEAASVLKLYLELEPIMQRYFAPSAGAPVEAFEGEIAAHPVFKLIALAS